MKFKSTDELEQFRFQDAQIHSFLEKDQVLSMELEAVIVRGKHPLNETYTDRYADTVYARFLGGKIVRAFKEGYRYYDASDKLVEEVPDEELDAAESAGLRKLCKDGHIFVLESPKSLKEKLEEQFPEQMEEYAVTAKENGEKVAILAVDVDSEEEEREFTYWMAIAYDKVVLEWEHMMNKPEQM
ncbi:MAG: hypothetical protein E7294_02340 [Lachnospiraceae bacterium]|jgi:hypothetical protein|nr:hypothetical protein [Lachnospiraceae bacterium]